MAEQSDEKRPSDPAREREDRLAKALRDNLRRRKAQGGQGDSLPDPGKTK